MARKDFRHGLGQLSRERQSFEREPARPQEQLMGFHIGIVMDDMDDQRIGQIWVYLPSVSARRFSEDALPAYGGTSPDRDNQDAQLKWDQNLRLGWIQCYPLLPFFGADNWRVQRSRDGDIRNARNGDVQSYGMWAQPRIGDHVGVLFANGDPSKAFWVGMVPEFNRNSMVPGNAGRRPQDFDEKQDADGTAVHQQTRRIKEEGLIAEQGGGEAVLIPAMDKTRRPSNDPDNPVEIELTDVLTASEAAFNVQAAGLLCDSLRGAGTSSARRESPSYVFGFKSAGWNFDSEKKNRNTAGGTNTRFEDDESLSRYQDVATAGHQFVMDDHPDFQSIRMRTSHGHQVYLNDSCDDPFIHISTGRGNVWIELTEGGQVQIFSEASVSVHAREDINLTADRDLNIDVQQDFKLLVRGDTEIDLKGQVEVETGRNNLKPDGLKYTPRDRIGDTTRQNVFIRNFGNVDWSIDDHFGFTIGNGPDSLDGGADILIKQGNLELDVTDNIDIRAAQDITIQALGNNMDLKAADDVSIEAVGGRMDIRSGSTMHQSSGSQMNMEAGANIHMEASPDIHLNGPSADPADNAVDADPAIEAAEPEIRDLIQVPVAPTDDEIKFCRRTKNFHNTLDRSIVPQHHPWPERCQTRIGFAGNAEEGAVISRNGGVDATSTHPLPKVEQGGVFNASPYSGNNQGEAPQYTQIRPVEPGELGPCSTYTTSDRMIQFLKKEEGSRNKAYLDAGKYAIGFGHQINVGDTINGDTIMGRVTQDDIRRLNRTGGDLRIGEAEKERLLREDLQRFEAAVCNAVSTDITQHQFDALVSFAYNTGPGNMRRMVNSSNLNSGDFTNVPQKWMQYHKCTGCAPAKRAGVEEVLKGRRRRELEQFFAYSGDPVDPVTGQKSIADVTG